MSVKTFRFLIILKSAKILPEDCFWGWLWEKDLKGNG